MTMLEKELLQVSPIAYIEPGVRGNKAERTFTIQE
jgi:hypothetical protein